VLKRGGNFADIVQQSQQLPHIAQSQLFRVFSSQLRDVQKVFVEALLLVVRLAYVSDGIRRHFSFPLG
jgi:hypothetical protein